MISPKPISAGQVQKSLKTRRRTFGAEIMGASRAVRRFDVNKIERRLSRKMIEIQLGVSND